MQNKNKAILQARTFIDQACIIVDTETTGLGTTDEIIEIACIDINGLVLLESLVKPTCHISNDAERIHGITISDLDNAPSMDTLALELKQVIQDRIVLSYNFDFDSRLVRQSLHAVGLRWTEEWNDMRGSREDHCIMYWYGRYRPRESGRSTSLADALKQCGIVAEYKGHRALYDAQAARRLLLHMGQSKPD